MMAHFFVVAALAMTTVLNIIIPLPGSVVVTPLLATLTDPHTAIGITAFYFFLSGVVRVSFFWKHIRWDLIRALIVPSSIAAVVGAASLFVVPEEIILVVIFFGSAWFLLKKLGILPGSEDKKISLTQGYVVGSFSGFLQGVGLPGSDMRSSFLYSKGMSVIEGNGTSAFLGASNFLLATITRLFTDQLSMPNITTTLFLVPILVIGTYAGKKMLFKIPKKSAEKLVVVIMTIIVVSLGVKVAGSLPFLSKMF